MTSPRDNYCWGLIYSSFGLLFVGAVHDFRKTDAHQDLTIGQAEHLPNPSLRHLQFAGEEHQLDTISLALNDYQIPIPGKMSLKETLIGDVRSDLDLEDRQQTLVHQLASDQDVFISNKLSYMTFSEREAWLSRIENSEMITSNQLRYMTREDYHLWLLALSSHETKLDQKKDDEIYTGTLSHDKGLKTSTRLTYMTYQERQAWLDQLESSNVHVSSQLRYMSFSERNAWLETFENQQMIGEIRTPSLDKLDGITTGTINTGRDGISSLHTSNKVRYMKPQEKRQWFESLTSHTSTLGPQVTYMSYRERNDWLERFKSTIQLNRYRDKTSQLLHTPTLGLITGALSKKSSSYIDNKINYMTASERHDWINQFKNRAASLTGGLNFMSFQERNLWLQMISSRLPFGRLSQNEERGAETLFRALPVSVAPDID